VNVTAIYHALALTTAATAAAAVVTLQQRIQLHLAAAQLTQPLLQMVVLMLLERVLHTVPLITVAHSTTAAVVARAVAAAVAAVTALTATAAAVVVLAVASVSSMEMPCSPR
jgi:hypothetical protein